MNLFHSLVVCGASLTLLECGGKAQLPGEAGNEGGSGGGGTSGAAGSADLAGAFPTAGALAAAGTSSSAGAAGSHPWQQWECGPEDVNRCTPSGLSSRQASAVELQHPCPVNSQRPREASDCAPPLMFSCLLGVLDNVTGPINCECTLPTSDVACPCPARISGCLDSTSDACGGSQNYCDCAYTCILVPK